MNYHISGDKTGITYGIYKDPDDGSSPFANRPPLFRGLTYKEAIAKIKELKEKESKK